MVRIFYHCARSGLIPAFALVVSFAVPASGEDPFHEAVEPLLEKLCYECHGPETQKGDIRLDSLPREYTHAETWHDALDQLNRGEMPPRKATQPSAEELNVLTSGLNAFLREAAAAKRAEGGRVEARRLTRYEYNNTMRDLLGIEYDFANELPPEPASPDGFLNNGNTLEISPTQIETYLKVARRGLAIAIPDPSLEEAKTYRYQQSETALGYLPNRNDGGHAPVQPEYILDVPEFPREGKFRVTITAKLANPDGADFPKMVVSMGHVPGIIHVPRKTIGEAELSSMEPETFTFTGRMEDFPLMGLIPFGRSGFKGQIVMVDFVNADGGQLRYPDHRYAVKPPQPKKGQKAQPKPPTPKPFGSRLEIEVVEAEFVGPIVETSLLSLEEPEAAIRNFAGRAFRRTVNDAEVAPYLSLFETLKAEEKMPLIEALRETCAAILVSPHFLYRAEGSGAENAANYQLASRLSYLFWSTMPDEELFALAKEGTLTEEQVLTEQIDRLLSDPRSEEFVSRFADQWLGLDGLDRVAVDPNTFPDFKESLKHDLRGEVHAVFSEVLKNDLSMLELLDSDWSMMNRNLAKHYGLSGPRSASFERVSLPANSPRGGLLGHGAFHLTGSNGDESHPIKRAVWILDRLLDAPPASPPPDTPELDSENPDFSKLTLKQQLEAHREKESCNNCHRNIDPWGLALENFDPLGSWRESDSINTTLPDGNEIVGVEDLKNYLLENRRSWYARSVVRRLMAFSYGRSLDVGDHEVVDALNDTFAEEGYRLRPLLVALLSNEVAANR